MASLKSSSTNLPSHTSQLWISTFPQSLQVSSHWNKISKISKLSKIIKIAQISKISENIKIWLLSKTFCVHYTEKNWKAISHKLFLVQLNPHPRQIKSATARNDPKLCFAKEHTTCLKLWKFCLKLHACWNFCHWKSQQARSKHFPNNQLWTEKTQQFYTDGKCFCRSLKIILYFSSENCDKFYFALKTSDKTDKEFRQKILLLLSVTDFSSAKFVFHWRISHPAQCI